MTLPTFRTGPQGPATHCYVITPHDTNPLPAPIKAIRADGAGAVVMRFAESAVDVTITMLAGETIRGVITHVRATGTAAITLHGLA